MWFRNPLIRNIDAGDLLENFLVAAVFSVLTIRFYLEISGYPEIGAGQFHIAHLLFGGFFMMGALILMIAYLNKTIMQIGAILGGIGFGTFIDELGKFITQDNNYFYQPTAALLYVIFILLFLLFRSFEKNTRLTKKEYLMNALEMMENVIYEDLDPEEKKTTYKLLQKCDQKDPTVIALKKVLEHSDVIPASENSIEKIRLAGRTLYWGLIRNRWFLRGIIIFFLVQSLLTILSAITVILTIYFNRGFTSFIPITLSFNEIAEIIASTASGICVVLGALMIYHSRLRAFHLFRISLLISIFFTQFFVFYREQFSAVVTLFFNIILLVAVQYMIQQEALRDN